MKIALLLALLLGALPAIAADIPVTNGVELQAAVNAANPGDRIVVAAGNYNRFLAIGFSVDAEHNGIPATSGLPGQPITITCPTRQCVWTNDPTIGIDHWSSGGVHFIKLIQRSYWTIDGFTFDNKLGEGLSSSFWTYGINVQAGEGPIDGIVIENNTFLGNDVNHAGGTVISYMSGWGDTTTGSPLPFWWIPAGQTKGVNNSAIRNNRFIGWRCEGCDMMGVTMESIAWRQGAWGAWPNENVVIAGNYFNGFGGDGVHCGVAACRNVIIENNTCETRYQTWEENCVDIKLGSNRIVRGNKMIGYKGRGDGGGQNGMVLHGRGLYDDVIEDNIFANSMGGLVIGMGYFDQSEAPWMTPDDGPVRTIVRRNLFVNFTDPFLPYEGWGTSMTSSGAKDLTIENNVYAHTDRAGLEVTNNLGTLKINGNIFYDNGRVESSGGGVPGGFSIRIDEPTSQVQLGANAFHRPSGGEKLSWRVGNISGTGTLAQFQAATGQGAGAINSDPLFVNPALDYTAADYHVQTGSPATGMGIYTTGSPPPPPPPPPPPDPVPTPETVLDVDKSVTRCRFVLTAKPPDSTKGWTATFFRGSTQIGTADSAPPYQRTVQLGIGAYEFRAEFSKTGVPTVTSEVVVEECP